jgi:hypothetical protein
MIYKPNDCLHTSATSNCIASAAQQINQVPRPRPLYTAPMQMNHSQIWALSSVFTISNLAHVEPGRHSAQCPELGVPTPSAPNLQCFCTTVLTPSSMCQTSPHCIHGHIQRLQNLSHDKAMSRMPTTSWTPYLNRQCKQNNPSVTNRRKLHINSGVVGYEAQVQLRALFCSAAHKKAYTDYKP